MQDLGAAAWIVQVFINNGGIRLSHEDCGGVMTLLNLGTTGLDCSSTQHSAVCFSEFHKQGKMSMAASC